MWGRYRLTAIDIYVEPVLVCGYRSLCGAGTGLHVTQAVRLHVIPPFGWSRTSWLFFRLGAIRTFICDLSLFIFSSDYPM
jgi:hypothetical protein